MPEMGGIEATKRIVENLPETFVVLCSTYEINDLPPDAKTSGARAYVNKETLGAKTLRRLWISVTRLTSRVDQATGSDRGSRAVADLGLPAYGAADGAETVHHVDVTVAALRVANVEARSVVAHLEE